MAERLTREELEALLAEALADGQHWIDKCREYAKKLDESVVREAVLAEALRDVQISQRRSDEHG